MGHGNATSHLRQHQAIQYHYSTGKRVYYWRDAPGGAGPKLRWKGLAVVMMIEPARIGPTTNTYCTWHYPIENV